MRFGLFSRAWILASCYVLNWVLTGNTCAHEGVMSRVNGTLSSLYFWLRITVAYPRCCEFCWYCRERRGRKGDGVCVDRECSDRTGRFERWRMQGGDVKDCFANGLNDIRGIDRMVDIAVDDGGCRSNICHNRPGFSVAIANGFTTIFLRLYENTHSQKKFHRLHLRWLQRYLLLILRLHQKKWVHRQNLRFGPLKIGLCYKSHFLKSFLRNGNALRKPSPRNRNPLPFNPTRRHERHTIHGVQVTLSLKRQETQP